MFKQWKVHFLNNYQRLQGELTSQETDGWYTLANTSSSRVYLKQAFQENSNLLGASGGTITIITGGHNHKDQLTYAWKDTSAKCTTR